jgi:hypothetical protein
MGLNTFVKTLRYCEADIWIESTIDSFWLWSRADLFVINVN